MLTVTAQHGAVAQFLARRDAAGISLAAQAAAIAETAFAMAQRFRAGGKLLAFGNGNAGTDAAHLAVEFMHPVIVGKPAIAAVALSNDTATMTGIASGPQGLAGAYAHQISALARPTDVALAVSAGGDCPGIGAGLRAASELGLLTVLLAGSGGGEANHVVRVESDDPVVVKEIHVTIYHLLWELVHVQL